jgi:pimeloyl-ACP methyl ester carboxylesterase
MITLAVIVALLGAGAVVTLIGVRLMDWMKLPRGRFIDVGGFRQHVVELGRGREAPGAPIVLLHGAGANLEDMDIALGERLAARHRVILLDRPGFGFSARKAGEGSSPAYQAAVLRLVLDGLGVDRVILVGHSWGGTLALTFALDYPQRVAGLVVIAPPTHPHLRDLTRLHRWLTTPFGRLFAHTLALPFGLLLMRLGVRNAFSPQKMPREYIKRSATWLVLRPATLFANWADIAHLEPFLARQAERYGELVAPTIAIAGDRDTLVPTPLHSELLAAAAPSVKLSVLPGFGHMLHHDAADHVAAAVAEVASRG